MKITYNWIKKYIKLNARAEDLASKLTMSGSEVGTFEKSGDDVVMELEITANRPDCLNIIGMAREASAVFDQDLILPDFTVKEEGKGPDMKIEVNDDNLCPRYTARVITTVSVAALLGEIKKLILSVGMREVNNIVDITNYCLMETGQPMHAFDLDKITGGKVVVRKAKKGEKLITIDEVERKLEEGMLVIADESGPIAIAGVMGGKRTEVTDKTKNILLESAYFDPIAIRRTARKLCLSSDSSYRFERGVDKAMVKKASDRASALISEYAGGKINQLYDVGKVSGKKIELTLDINKTGKILGVSLENKTVATILKRLGMEVEEEKESFLRVKVPSYREDITREIDLVEEVGRIYGYDNIPERVEKIIPQTSRKDKARKVKEKVCTILAGCGMNEIMTYSLINEKSVKAFPEFNKDIVELWNPISEEHKILTPQLLSGMLRSVIWNINRNNKDLGLFEIAKSYNSLPENGYKETSTLSLGLTGCLRKNWQEGDRIASFFDLKGIVEKLLKKLNLAPVFLQSKMEGFINCVEIKIDNEFTCIGFIGEAGPGLLREHGIEQQVFLSHIDLEKVAGKATLDVSYRSIPKFPFSVRDISIVCKKTMNIGDVEKVIKSSCEQRVHDVEIVSVYEGDSIPEDKRSVSFSIKYGDLCRTLKDEEIEEAHAKICKLISEKLNIEFR